MRSALASFRSRLPSSLASDSALLEENIKFNNKEYDSTTTMVVFKSDVMDRVVYPNFVIHFVDAVGMLRK